MARSAEMLEVFATCARVAASEAPVLVIGETGTGKELIARAIHRRSGRRGRFVALNSASVQPALVESELFGHERGAFTGAERSKIGAVRYASGGTLFLDEIGDLPLEGQCSLLRFLQEGTVRPVGAYDELAVDVRVVAATHVALDEAVQRGAFREDLYYRLNVLRVHLPPLRARTDDVRILLSHFVKRAAQRYERDVPVIGEGFWQGLCEQSLPGNVRQLQSIAERIVVSRPRRPLRAADLPRYMDNRPKTSRTTTAEPPSPVFGSTSQRVPGAAAIVTEGVAATGVSVDLNATLCDNIERSVRAVEHAYLTQALSRTHGRITDAATLAGVSRRTLHRKLLDLGIDKSQFRLQTQGSEPETEA